MDSAVERAIQAIGQFLAGLPSNLGQTLLLTNHGPTAITDQPSIATRVPPEILADIFKYVRLTFPPLWGWGRTALHGSIGWIVISHVCRRWRAVILDMPSFWGNLSDAPIPWAHEMIRRSRDADLQVSMHPRGDQFNPVGVLFMGWRQRRLIRQVAANAHRVETVTIVGSMAYAFLQGALASAPRLTHLNIDGRDWATLFALGGSTRADFSLPPNLFAGQVPSLARLTLSDIPICADSPLLTANLTHLSLTRSRGTKCPRSLPLLDFVQIILRMPLLETLSAGDILTEPASDAALEESLAQYPAIHLPHLTGLEIRSPWILNYRSLMQRLELDFSALQLNMGTAIRIHGGHQDPLLPPSLAPHLRAIQLSSDAPGRLSMTGFRDMGDFMSPDVVFSASIEVIDAPALDGARFLAEELPLHTVEKLTLFWQSTRSDGSADWAPFLCHLPAIDHLEIFTDGAQTLDILHALAETAIDQFGDTQVVCPCLARLCFPCKVFGAQEEAMVFWSALADALEARLVYGAHLEELSMGHGTAIPCADADAIKTLRMRGFHGLGFEP